MRSSGTRKMLARLLVSIPVPPARLRLGLALAFFSAFFFSCIVWRFGQGLDLAARLLDGLARAGRRPARRARCRPRPGRPCRAPRRRRPCRGPARRRGAPGGRRRSRPAASPRSVTVTSSYSSRKGLLKPNFGRRRCSGIWPPSKPSKCMLPERAFWPFPPRPAVLPRPEPWPRPTRLRTLVAPRGAFSWFSDDMSVPFYLDGARRARRPWRPSTSWPCDPPAPARPRAPRPRGSRPCGSFPWWTGCRGGSWCELVFFRPMPVTISRCWAGIPDSPCFNVTLMAAIVVPCPIPASRRRSCRASGRRGRRCAAASARPRWP